MQTPAHIEFSQLPGSSKLFLDFLSGEAAAHYHHDFHEDESYRELQQALRRRRCDRLTLVEILRRQNQDFGAGPRTFENIEKLGQAETLAVVTGQQVTLFGGSLLTFYKAAVAVKLAETNCRELKTNVVPVFWMASDDADFAEVARVSLPTQQAELQRLTYQPAADVSGMPMSTVILDEGIEDLLAQYRHALPETEFTDDLFQQLQEIYRPGRSMVAAFARYLNWVLQDQGLILIDPGDPLLRKLAGPVFAKEIQLRRRSSEVIAGQNAKLQADGYHLQVTRPPDYTNLFYDDRVRLRIDLHGDGFRIAERTYSQRELEDLLETAGERFSPNVFLRPIVQSYLFPTLVHFVGPAEVAYIAQIKGLFDLFEAAPAVIYPRYSATIIEGKVSRVLTKFDLSITDIAGGVDQILSNLVRRDFPPSLESDFAASRAAIKERLEALLQQLDQSDEGLMTTARKSVGRVDLEIKNLEKKAFQAQRKRNKTVKYQLQRTAFFLFPGGHLQETVFPLTYFIARYGPRITKTLYDAVDCQTDVHHLINLKED